MFRKLFPDLFIFTLMREHCQTPAFLNAYIEEMKFIDLKCKILIHPVLYNAYQHYIRSESKNLIHQNYQNLKSFFDGQVMWLQTISIIKKQETKTIIEKIEKLEELAMLYSFSNQFKLAIQCKSELIFYLSHASFGNKLNHPYVFCDDKYCRYLSSRAEYYQHLADEYSEPKRQQLLEMALNDYEEIKKIKKDVVDDYTKDAAALYIKLKRYDEAIATYQTVKENYQQRQGWCEKNWIKTEGNQKHINWLSRCAQSIANKIAEVQAEVDKEKESLTKPPQKTAPSFYVKFLNLFSGSNEQQPKEAKHNSYAPSFKC